MKIVGLIGPKGSGKDTAADTLIAEGKAKGKLSFAGPLKEIVSRVFNIPPTLLNDPELKNKKFVDMKNYGEPVKLTSKLLKNVIRELPKYVPEVNEATQTFNYNLNRVTLTGLVNMTIESPRQLLQVIGTELIRNKVSNTWHLEAAFSDKALAKCTKSGVYCVTDIRFENEYDFLKDKFGSAFRGYYVKRGKCEKELKKATHPSETDVAKVREKLPEDQVIKNSTTLNSFKGKVLELDIDSIADSKSAASSEPKSRFVYERRY